MQLAEHLTSVNRPSLLHAMGGETYPLGIRRRTGCILARYWAYLCTVWFVLLYFRMSL